MVSYLSSRNLALRVCRLLASQHSFLPLHSRFKPRWALKVVNINFKSKFSVTNVSCNPSGVHQTVISEISHVLRSSLPPEAGDKLIVCQDHTVVGFKGKYASSTARPDLMLQYVGSHGELQCHPLLVLELWIEGTDTVSIAMLIKIREFPEYKNPLSKPSARRTRQLPKLPSVSLEDVKLKDPRDPGSPLLMYGLPFAGELQASFELWRRNKDGEAELDGQSIKIYKNLTTSTNVEIPLSQFMPPRYDAEGQRLILNWQDITKGIEYQRRMHAFTRCWNAVKQMEEGSLH